MEAFKLDENTGAISRLSGLPQDNSYMIWGYSDKFLFQVVATESDPASHVISYRFDPVSGALMKVADYSDTAGNTFGVLTASEDGRCLFAFGHALDPTSYQDIGYIYTFSISPEGNIQPVGKPFQASSSSLGTYEEGVVQIQSTSIGHLLFTVTAGSGPHASYSDVVKSLDIRADGAISDNSTITVTSCYACLETDDTYVGSAITNDARFALVSESLSGIHVFSLDQNAKATEVAGSPFPVAGSPSPNYSTSNFVFANPNLFYVWDGTSAVRGFFIQPDGTLDPASHGAQLANGRLLAGSLSGRFVLVGREGVVESYLVHNDGTLELKSSVSTKFFHPVAVVPGSAP